MERNEDDVNVDPRPTNAKQEVAIARLERRVRRLEQAVRAAGYSAMLDDSPDDN